MHVKLICSDIDGTLLNKEKELSDKTIAEIIRIAPTLFILISSRMPYALTHLQKELDILPLPLIAYNGGLIISDGEIISSTEISNDSTQKIYEFCKKTSLHLSLYYHNEWYVPSMDFWAQRESNNTKVKPTIQKVKETLKNWKSKSIGAHKIMVMGDPEDINALVDYLDKNFTNEIVFYRSKPEYLEIAHQSISKKTAIDTLLTEKYPQIKMENVLAFGDNYNDIEMLQSVGAGVAVSNAIDDVLTIADFVSSANVEDGVANYLESFL